MLNSWPHSPKTPAFDEAWYPGETPHLIRSTSISARPNRLEAYNLTYAEKDRDLQDHQDTLGFAPQEVPKGGILLVIGPGLTRYFERQLHGLRPDIHIASIDPLLRDGVRERLREGIRTGSHEYTDPALRYGINFPSQLLDRYPYYRLGGIAGAIAIEGGITEGLPFKDASFDSVLALHSLPQYSRIKEGPFILAETARVMKPGATARFYPFFPVDLPALDHPDTKKLISDLVVEELPPHLRKRDWTPKHRRVVFGRKE